MKSFDGLRAERIEQVVASFRRRRAAGESVSLESVLAAHPDLLPELAGAMSRAMDEGGGEGRGSPVLELSESALVTETLAHPASLRSDEFSIGGRTSTASVVLQCPQCRETLALALAVVRYEVTCPQCGKMVRVVAPVAGAVLGRVARFELREILGSGGFGTVWRARDAELDREVAVKIPRGTHTDPVLLDELLHEARVAAALKHPGIVTVHELGRDGDTPYIVSDLIDGVPLSQWRKTHDLSFQEIAALCAKITRTLHYAHEQGIIHRDLKPQNVLMDSSGEPHISDFGLAKRQVDAAAIAADGRIMGTPAYMPPEQARGEGWRVGPPGDVYSLGVLLFELLTGELPFRGNPVMLIRQVVEEPPPRPQRLNEEVPTSLEKICLKCLQKRPEDRYPTAAALADDLQRFCEGLPVRANPTGPVASTLGWCRRNPRIPALVGLFVLMLAVILLAGRWTMARAIRHLEVELTARALDADRFTADTAATIAGEQFARRFAQVEQYAAAAPLVAALRAVVEDPALVDRMQVLDAASNDDATLEPERLALARHPRIDALQLHVATLPQQDFAWFVLGPQGLQLARNPVVGAEQTIGRNYAWRSYYHAGPTDLPPSERPLAHLRETKLSEVFISQFTHRWVIVVSTPIVDGERFLGVLGLMVELGTFVDLPGNRVGGTGPADTNTADRFAVLVDGRDPNRGIVLQHPYYLDGGAAAAGDREALRAATREVRVTLENWQGRLHQQYGDPFAERDARFAHRYLAACAPLVVREQETGLVVLVQERYDRLIGEAVAVVIHWLGWLSLAIALWICVFLLVLWGLLVQRLRR